MGFSLKTKVLLVDDHDIILITQMQLWKQNHGIRPRCAKSGQEALSIAKLQDFDLIVIDLKMPKMNGQELIKELRKRGVDAVIIVLSADNEKAAVEEAIKAGANDYILKPLDADLYFYKIKQHMFPDEFKIDADLDKK